LLPEYQQLLVLDQRNYRIAEAFVLTHHFCRAPSHLERPNHCIYATSELMRSSVSTFSIPHSLRPRYSHVA
jgi:hypothetical protein